MVLEKSLYLQRHSMWYISWHIYITISLWWRDWNEANHWLLLCFSEEWRTKSEESDGIAARVEVSWIVEVCWSGDVCAAWGFGIIRGEIDCSNGWKARKAVAGRDFEWWQLRKALHQVWAFYATRHGKEILPEDMEKYAFRKILSCWGTKGANIQNLALLLVVTT